MERDSKGRFVKGHKVFWNNGNKGKPKRPRTIEHRNNLSKGNKGQVPWNKGKIMGFEYGQLRSKARSIESRLNMSNGRMGIKFSKEHKDNLSLAQNKRYRIKRQSKIYKHTKPFYNPQACSWFDWFNRSTNTNGQHATNGKEYQVLGYFLDYFNPELKLIIEWDEPHHFYTGQRLKSYYANREKQIRQHFPDFYFMRIIQ